MGKAPLLDAAVQNGVSSSALSAVAAGAGGGFGENCFAKVRGASSA